jgi:hypothetical protein
MPDDNEPVREEQIERKGHTFRLKVYRRTCATCGKEFEGGPRARFCSPTCRVKDWDQRHPENRKERGRRNQRARYARLKAEREQGIERGKEGQR